MTMRQQLAQQYGTSNNLQARIAIHERFSTNPQDWVEWLWDIMQLPRQGRVLELGGGTGRLWHEHRQQLGQLQISYSDHSLGMVQTAKNQLADLAQLNFSQVDAHYLPFADSSFDVVIANHMLYHVADQPLALAEIRRVLKPNSLFFAATNGNQHMHEIKELIQAVDPSADVTPFSLSFTLENGVALLQSQFEQVEMIKFENNLAVTEVEPIVEYVRSTQRLSEEHLEVCRELVSEQLAANQGLFPIQKSVGLFVCR